MHLFTEETQGNIATWMLNMIGEVSIALAQVVVFQVVNCERLREFDVERLSESNVTTYHPLSLLLKL